MTFGQVVPGERCLALRASSSEMGKTIQNPPVA